jgi:hypothetical protein
MKLKTLLLLMIILISTLTAQDTDINDNQPGKIEEKIWSLEEDYISYFKEANHDAVLSLYHSQFLGWPDSELHPAGKERAAEFLKEEYPEPAHVVFNIKREGITMIEGVVITYYLLTLSWFDDEEVEQLRNSRIIHTWVKENSDWRILGGMSNRK